MWREACVRMKKCIWNEAEAGIPILENYFQNEEDKEKDKNKKDKNKRADCERKRGRKRREREREGGER